MHQSAQQGPEQAERRSQTAAAKILRDKGDIDEDSDTDTGHDLHSAAGRRSELCLKAQWEQIVAQSKVALRSSSLQLSLP